MKKPTWKKKLLLLVASLLAALLLAEAALRIAGVSHPVFYAPDDVLASRFRPGQEGWFTAEGRAYVRINRHGWRDRERSRAKPPDTFRIAVLGDSYAEALQVPLEKTFWSILEHRLNAAGGIDGKTVEVLNFGKSGFGTAQEYLALHHYAWEYRPDAVLLAFTTANDVADNSRALTRDPCKPYFLLSGGELQLDDSFLGSQEYVFRKSWKGRVLLWLLDWSRLAQLVLRAKLNVHARAAEGDRDDSFLEPGLELESYLPPATEAWKQAWRVTEALLAKMQAEARDRGAKLLVVTVTNALQVNPDASRRSEFQRRHGLEHVFYTDFRIRDLGRQTGVPVLNLAPEFRARAEKQKVFFHGFGDRKGIGHWNRRGHALAGELIARWILDIAPSGGEPRFSSPPGAVRGPASSRPGRARPPRRS